MVISEPGLLCLAAANSRIARGFASFWFGQPVVPAAPAYQASALPPHRVTPAAAIAESSAALPGSGDDPPADPVPHDPSAPLTAQERRARAAAYRGLMHGRQRRYAAAQSAFAEAARLDPLLTLESIPTFWAMERGAHEAAVRAYLEAGREQESAFLASRLRTTFRPRLVAAPTPIG